MKQAMFLKGYETPFYTVDRFVTCEVGNEVTLKSGIIGYFTLLYGRRIFVPYELLVIHENTNLSSR